MRHILKAKFQPSLWVNPWFYATLLGLDGLWLVMPIRVDFMPRISDGNKLLGRKHKGGVPWKERMLRDFNLLQILLWPSPTCTQAMCQAHTPSTIFWACTCVGCTGKIPYSNISIFVLVILNETWLRPP